MQSIDRASIAQVFARALSVISGDSDYSFVPWRAEARRPQAPGNRSEHVSVKTPGRYFLCFPCPSRIAYIPALFQQVP